MSLRRRRFELLTFADESQGLDPPAALAQEASSFSEKNSKLESCND
jgi:hypothetical protein